MPGLHSRGGELGYSLSHSFGAAFDNPELIVACVIGDGEAETGRWPRLGTRTSFSIRSTDGAVLPILHLNGYKIANPTLLARISREELEQLLRGYGWAPHFVEGHEPALMHEAMATALDAAVEAIKAIQRGRSRQWQLAAPALADARPRIAERMDRTEDDRWPAERRNVSLASGAARRLGNESPEHLRQLEAWLESYRPEELFDAQRTLEAGARLTSARRHAAHGRQPPRQRGPPAARIADAGFPRLRCGSRCPRRTWIGDTHVLGRFLRDVAKENSEERNFRGVRAG
jgi:xylulose-5-phosphate/fructose-6-phosphate phosphoketolase